MIDRYSYPEMGKIWEPETKFGKWLDIEIKACEANAELGLIPSEALSEIKAKAAFDIKRIDEVESEVHHDVIAFLTSVSEKIGPASKYIHYGMTSSDVLDTGLSLQLKDAADLLIGDLRVLGGVLKREALQHRNLLMAGRTHGVHAEPVTLGMKLAIWSFETRRNMDRLIRAKDAISVGKISGVVGSYANINPKVEAYVCESLDLKPAEASSQIIQRDRHAEFLTVLAIVASSLDKFATEIRHLQKTEVLEAEEPFAARQKGSSAMPHKKNPILCERISGLARVIRGNAIAGLENVALWHERDISHSSAERVILPDSTILLDYMLKKFIGVMEELVIHDDRMMQNLELTHGLIFSQRVLLELVSKGMVREKAYEIVQRNAMESWNTGKNFKDMIATDPEASLLTPGDLNSIFDYNSFLGNAPVIFDRLEKLVF